MKKVIYICDACGKQIDGMPIKLMPCQYDQYGEIAIIPADDLEEKARKIEANDYCADCFRSACYMLDPEETEEPEELTDEEEEEICDRIENTPKKSGRYPQLDVGKIKALYNAGWKATEIAAEMKCAESAVYRHLKNMRESGEII